jgi:prevent-host-death family protein
MSKVVNIHAAKTNFSKLVDEVEAGADIVIARAGKPVLRLVKFEASPPKRQFGFAANLLEEFDEQAWAKLDDEFNSLFRNF